MSHKDKVHSLRVAPAAKSISPKGNAEIRWLATAMGSLVKTGCKWTQERLREERYGFFSQFYLIGYIICIYIYYMYIVSIRVSWH